METSSPLDNEWGEIHSAASQNNLKVVQALVNNDSLLRDTKTDDGETPIVIAALNGSLDVVEWLHEREASLREILSNGNSVIHCAAASNCPRTLNYVLSQEGMEHYVNSTNKMGETPMHVAVRCGSTECVRVLRSYWEDVPLRSQHTPTPRELAQSLGHTQCLQVLEDTSPLPTTEEHTDCDSRRSDVLATPVSLQNDQRGEFHNVPSHETAILAQGHDTPSRKGANSRGDGAKGRSQSSRESERNPPVTDPPAGNLAGPGAGQERSAGGGRAVPLAPLQPMKTKPKREGNIPAPQDVVEDSRLSEGGNAAQSTNQKTLTQKNGQSPPAVTSGSCDEAQTPQQQNPATDPSTICKKCGEEKTARAITVNQPKMIVVGHAIVQQAESLQCEELTCFHCTLRAMQTNVNGSAPTSMKEDVRLSQEESRERSNEGRSRNRVSESDVDERQRLESENNTNRERRESEGSTALRGRRTSEGSGVRRGSEIDGRSYSSSVASTEGQNTEEEIFSEDESIAGDHLFQESIQDSGCFTMPRNSSLPQDLATIPERAESPSLVEIRNHKTPVADSMEVRCGEQVSLYAKATPKGSHRLNYRWYEVQRGKPDKLIESRSTLKRRITKEVKVFCSVSLKDDESTAVKSKKVTITPKLVWITRKLALYGQYCGQRAQLKCTAEKHTSVKEKISYQWLKRTLPSHPFQFYKQTDSGCLTFDPLSPEDNGDYICQAEVVGSYSETNPVSVKGSIEPAVEVVRQPRSRVVAKGGSLELQCQARLRDRGSSESLRYQWLHKNTPIPGATSSTYKRKEVTADQVGQYRCRVSDVRGGRVLTEPATVALAYQEETDSGSGPRSLKQTEQLKAQQILQTADGTRYATDKVAILIGNEAYHHHRQLSSSVADVRTLKGALTEAGFKVFSLVNMRCDETMSALRVISDLLVAGVYMVFWYTGHGFNIGNTDYILPVDAHNPINPHQCIAIATISDLLQSKLCRVFVFFNCCRTKLEGPFSPPHHPRTCNYANYVTVTASLEGQEAFEPIAQGGEVVTFTTSFVDALREGGNYKNVIQNFLDKMKRVLVSDGVGLFAQPSATYSTMDSEISFQDSIMLDDQGLEEPLDKLLQTWRDANTPPGPVMVGPEQLGTDLSQLVEGVCLSFECDCSNVLEVVIKWRVAHTPVAAGISCIVEMVDQGQGVDIERSSMQDYEARFRISSLQRLSVSEELNAIDSTQETYGSSSGSQSVPVITQNLLTSYMTSSPDLSFLQSQISN